MSKTKEKFVVNNRGRRVSVILDIVDYERMLAEVEELESIRAYDAAKASGEESLPFETVAEEIERKQR